MPAPDHLSTVTTERLLLERPGEESFAELYALHAHPRVWEHLPTGRHTSEDQTRRLVDEYDRGWEENGLDVWVARDRHTRELVGAGGPSLRGARAWNLYYRLAPAAWRRGYAQEIIAASRAATAATGTDLPHVAFLLEHNEGSRRAAERAGLKLAWRGPDAGNPDPHAIRLVYADRALDEQTLSLFV